MDINNPIFQNEDSAREYLEAVRWPDGPFCPHCGEAENVMKLEGKAHRPGLLQCRSCRKQFSVTVGTLFERSKIPLNKWLMATYLLSSSKKGISTHQLHRMLGITYKSAWFMTHRIREAMREKANGKMGGGGSTVEVDETFVGRTTTRKGEKRSRGLNTKEQVLTLVERKGGARSFHVPAVNAKTLLPIIKEQINADTNIMTDEAGQYVSKNQYGGKRQPLKDAFTSHEYVTHSAKEYVRGDVHTNTIENYFSILKRGLNGTYQHVSAKHLKRYLGEFDFRYNHRSGLGVSDIERAEAALKGIEGKRLTYRRTHAGE